MLCRSLTASRPHTGAQGDKVSHYSMNNIQRTLEAHPTFFDDPARALKETFVKVDEELKKVLRPLRPRSPAHTLPAHPLLLPLVVPPRLRGGLQKQHQNSKVSGWWAAQGTWMPPGLGDGSTSNVFKY